MLENVDLLALVNFGRNFPSSLLRWQNGLGTAWPGLEPEVKRPENAALPHNKPGLKGALSKVGQALNLRLEEL